MGFTLQEDHELDLWYLTLLVVLDVHYEFFVVCCLLLKMMMLLFFYNITHLLLATLSLAPISFFGNRWAAAKNAWEK